VESKDDSARPSVIQAVQTIAQQSVRGGAGSYSLKASIRSPKTKRLEPRAPLLSEWIDPRHATTDRFGSPHQVAFTQIGEPTRVIGQSASYYKSKSCLHLRLRQAPEIRPNTSMIIVPGEHAFQRLLIYLPNQPTAVLSSPAHQTESFVPNNFSRTHSNYVHHSRYQQHPSIVLCYSSLLQHHRYACRPTLPRFTRLRLAPSMASISQYL
jgi:hypothetical protein